MQPTDPSKLSLLGLSVTPWKRGETIIGYERNNASSLYRTASPKASDKTEARTLLGRSIIFVPVRAVGSIILSLLNIIFLGQISVTFESVEDSLKGRVKAMGCSFLSALTTPLNMIVDWAGHIANAINPQDQRIKLLAEHMWTGFVHAKKAPKKTE